MPNSERTAEYGGPRRVAPTLAGLTDRRLPGVTQEKAMGQDSAEGNPGIENFSSRHFLTRAKCCLGYVI